MLMATVQVPMGALYVWPKANENQLAFIFLLLDRFKKGGSKNNEVGWG